MRKKTESMKVVYMIDVKNLTKKYGENTAINDLSFQINQGEVFGLLGPNGAGKTTTIRILCCLISKTSGNIKIEGYDTGNSNDSLVIRKMIGLVPDNAGLYEELSAYTNLDFYGKLYEVPEDERKEKIEYFLRLMDLWEKKDLPVSDLSKGMKQKIAIIRAMIHDPELLFFDEPTAHLDPESSRLVRDYIIKLKEEGKTIILSTHNLDEAQKICDRIAILKTRLLAINTPEELEKAVWGSKTVIQVEAINNKILAAVKNLNPKGLSVEANRIILELNDPQKENPDFVQGIVSAGGRIQYVTQLTSSLEETYLKIIEETK